MKTKNKKRPKADIPIWEQRPKPGEKWRFPGDEADPHSETRLVVERTLGGHVNYVSGRFTRFARIITITLDHWMAWQSKAKQIKMKGVF